MRIKLQVTIILACCLSTLSLPIHADGTLTIGVGISKPPYVMQEENIGMELEIVRRALEISGYKMKPRYMPILNIPHDLNAGMIDGGIHLKAHNAVDGFFSDDVIEYRNYAISRADSDEKLTTLSDLKGKRIIAFQNAHENLGNEYAQAVRGNADYRELADQALQVEMLATGNVDYIISDFRIFLYFKQKYEATSKAEFPPVRFHKLFPPTPYRAAFRKRSVRDAFDLGLAKLRETGEYDRIINHYTNEDDLSALPE